MKQNGTLKWNGESVLWENTRDGTAEPHSLPAERAVLGSILIDPDAALHVADWLKPSHFWLATHQVIYDNLIEMVNAGTRVDLVTITDRLDQNRILATLPDGIGYITDLINSTPSSIGVAEYGRVVKYYAQSRGLILMSNRTLELALAPNPDFDFTPVAEEAWNMLTLATEDTEISGPIAFSKLKAKYLDLITRRHEAGDIGLYTGLDLDKLWGPLFRKELVIIGGRPSMGKTALASQIAQNMSEDWGMHGCVYTLEMSGEQWIERIGSAGATVPTWKLQEPRQMNESEWDRLLRFIDQAEYPLYLDDTAGITPGHIRRTATRLKAEWGLDFMIVDYLQLMRSGITRLDQGDNRNAAMTYIADNLKEIAKDLNILLIALSQLSRAVESRHDKRPLLSDLRESGTIEQVGDRVVFPFRPGYYDKDTEYPNVMELHAAKNRTNGRLGSVSVYSNPDLPLIENLLVKEQPSKF